MTTPEVVQLVDDLLNAGTDEQVAAILNERGLRSGKGEAFSGRLVANIRRAYGLKTRYERLRAAGMLTTEEIAAVLGIRQGTVKDWYHAGLIQGYIYNDKHSCLYAPPGPDAPTKCQGRKLAKRRRFAELPAERAKEVQYAA
jgi:hypothetical protein